MGLEEKVRSIKVTTAAIMGLVIALLYYLAFFDDGSQRKNQIIRVEKDLASLNQEMLTLEKTFVDAKRLVELAKELGESINKVLKYIPEELTDTEVVKSLSIAARAVGAKIVGIRSRSRSAQQNNELYDELPVVVELVGTYGQVVAFLARLTHVERIYTVRDMKFNVISGDKDSKDSKVRFTTTVVGYKYKGILKEEKK